VLNPSAKEWIRPRTAPAEFHVSGVIHSLAIGRRTTGNDTVPETVGTRFLFLPDRTQQVTGSNRALDPDGRRNRLGYSLHNARGPAGNQA
jgi:hypothetical protein